MLHIMGTQKHEAWAPFYDSPDDKALVSCKGVLEDTVAADEFAQQFIWMTTAAIKKQYQNLHGNVSTGQLHKAHVSYTARPSHSGQACSDFKHGRR